MKEVSRLEKKNEGLMGKLKLLYKKGMYLNIEVVSKDPRLDK